MQVYSGELEVEGGEFELIADRIVIRESEVAFMFSGIYNGSQFKVDGIAKSVQFGKWISDAVVVSYTGFRDKERALIQFDEISPSPKKLRCKLTGKWEENGEIWPFYGNLSKFKHD